MQCSVSNLSRFTKQSATACHRYMTPTEKRVVKKLHTKRSRYVLVWDVHQASLDDHLESEVNVSKPRMHAHSMGCDCILCKHL